MKILTIFGTRPEAIKLAPVIQEMRKHRKKYRSVVCVTAQHRHMLDQVLDIFRIRPDHDLNIMKKDQDLFDLTARSLTEIKKVIRKVSPDLVLVQGDTTSAFIGSLAAFYSRIPVAHVEAGLRTHDKYRPFPEEINRKIISHIADVHFAPTRLAKANLLAEGINKRTVHVTGNTVIDALLMVHERQERPAVRRKWDRYFLERYGFDPGSDTRKILITGHRRENFGEAFRNICRALKDIALSGNDVEIIYPVHLNPNVQKPVFNILKGVRNVFLIPPLEYEPFVYLMARSYMILTDSGGIQEEAPSLGKPVLVLREVTERPEAVDVGTVRLVGSDRARIVRETARLLHDRKAYREMSRRKNPYGSGDASKRIINIIEKMFR